MSIQQNFPAISPSLSLNFARSKTLDPRITFTRTSTATRVNEQGLVEVVSADIPRFDHEYDASTGVIKSLGLLVEESRSNLLTYSEDFSVWTKQTGVAGTYVGLASTDIISPDGTSNATKFYVANEGGGFYNLYRSVGITSNTNYTYSVFMKKNEKDIVSLTVYTGSSPTGGNQFVFYNLTSGIVTGITTTGTNTGISSASIKPYNNDWYRCSMTFQLNVSTTVQVKLGADISSLNESIYIWGAQLEQGSFPTSYIPRPDASTATRNPDNVSMVGDNFSSWYNQSEGTIFCSANNNPGITTSTSRIFYAFRNSASPSGNFIRKWIWNGNTGLLLNSIYTSDGGPIAAEFSTSLETGNKKTAISYKQNDFARSYNGSVPLTDGGGNTPVGVNELQIGTNLSGHISQLTYYPRRLTNTQLQNLTK